MKIIPMAIPNDHMMAITESSLISVFFDMYSIPSADNTLNTAAPSKGWIPKKYPMPIPPKEVCVIPPLINTILRVTIYVPIIPHVILVNTAANKAFWKKLYDKSSTNGSKFNDDGVLPELYAGHHHALLVVSGNYIHSIVPGL